MPPISQEDAQRMQRALKTIASYYNPAAAADGAQAAAKLARETLEDLGLLYARERPGA
jgi:hypothetical protein